MKYLLGVASAALMLAGASSAFAAQAQATVTANATVVTPLSVTATKTLEFGKLVVNGGVAGTLVVAPSTGNRTSTGGVELVGLQSSVQAGAVRVIGDTVNGAPNPYTVTIPATATLSSGANSMSVTGIGSDTASLTTLTGQSDINIGGTLNVAGTQAAGAYTGSFVVTAAYN